MSVKEKAKKISKAVNQTISDNFSTFTLATMVFGYLGLYKLMRGYYEGMLVLEMDKNENIVENTARYLESIALGEIKPNEQVIKLLVNEMKEF